MLLKKISVLTSSLFVSCMVFAQNNNTQTNTDNLIDTFLKCDAQFFKELAKNKTSFEQFFELATTDNVAYIPVENIQKNDKNSVIFKKPFYYKGLSITGYKNIFVETPFLGQYFYWGFIINNDIDKVQSSLNNINWSKYSSNSYSANAQIYDRKNKSINWENNPYSIDGVVPRQGTIEKSLYLEPISNNQIQLLCSIQGDLTKDILYTIRPDIKPAYESIEAKQKEMIKAYKLKKQKEKELQQQNHQSQPDTSIKVKENDKQKGENI
ncbi:hypothetical protein [Gilliamella sp. wkB112]|uniref:hypothetical protein n=1 Tax=Gilliamella sp. wkB112 TaxID=3120257 RepID=UPI00080D920A|nr:hypothetical protein [Gilliamella apicola]OCG03156.1 hypothetical protein A9G12_09600 [Gilliamella apicola]